MIALPVRVSLHLTLSPTLYRRTPAHRSSPPCRACYRRSGGEVGWGVAKTLQGSGGRRTDRTDQAYQDLPRSARQLRSQEGCTALSHRGTVVSRIILRRSARGPRCLLALCVTLPLCPPGSLGTRRAQIRPCVRSALLACFIAPALGPSVSRTSPSINLPSFPLYSRSAAIYTGRLNRQHFTYSFPLRIAS